jgi:hypothetical protein
MWELCEELAVQVLSKFCGLGKLERLPREVISPNIQKEIHYLNPCGEGEGEPARGGE